LLIREGGMAVKIDWRTLGARLVVGGAGVAVMMQHAAAGNGLTSRQWGNPGALHSQATAPPRRAQRRSPKIRRKGWAITPLPPSRTFWNGLGRGRWLAGFVQRNLSGKKIWARQGRQSDEPDPKGQIIHPAPTVGKPQGLGGRERGERDLRDAD